MNKTTLLLAFLLTICISINAQISIKLTQGQKTHLINNSINHIKQTVMGQDVEVNSDVTLDIDVEVKSVSPDIHLSHTIKRVQIKSQVMGNSILYDSEKKEDRENAIGKVITNILEKPIDLYISNYGSPIENKKSHPSLNDIKDLLGNLEDLNSELVLALPNELKIGDHWIDEQSQDPNNISKFEYVVDSFDNNEAVLSFNGNIVNKENRTIQGMEATISSKSVSTGKLTVFIKTGQIKEKISAFNTNGTTEVMGQNIPFTLTRTSSSKTM